MPQYFPFI